MGRDPKSEFVLDTKGNCFLCMDPVSPPLVKLAPNDSPDPTTTYTIEYLTRFLEMDMRKVFKDTSSIAPQLLAKVQTSELKTELCEDCLRLSERFSRLQRHLEKIRLEINFCLGEIQKKLGKANNKEERETFQDVLGSRLNSDDLLKLEIAEVLRKVAANECIKMQSCQFPRIKLQKITDEGIASEILKLTLESSKPATRKDTPSHCSFEPLNEDSNGMVIDISEVKLEKHVPNLSPNTEATSDGDELHNSIISSGDEDEEDVDEPELKYSEPPESSTSSTTHIIKKHKSSNIKHGAIKKNGNRGHCGVVPPPIKIAMKMETLQGQYIQDPKSKRYRCQRCPHEYAAYYGFKRHYKSIHLQEKFGCGTCEKEYLEKVEYEIHFRATHAGLRFPCGKCAKSFTHPRSLKRHKKSAHLGLMFSCRVCSKSFTQSSSRNRHMRNHHRDKDLTHQNPQNKKNM